MTGSGRSGTGSRPYRRNRALLLKTRDTCAICGHGGARTADHIVPAKLWPRDANGKLLPGLDDLSNLRPAHGTMGNGQPPNRCPTCRRLCNQSRGARVASLRPASRNWFPRGIPGR